jgi:hypothetical protein
MVIYIGKISQRIHHFCKAYTRLFFGSFPFFGDKFKAFTAPHKPPFLRCIPKLGQIDRNVNIVSGQLGANDPG